MYFFGRPMGVIAEKIDLSVLTAIFQVNLG